jgi:hypothetical protein
VNRPIVASNRRYGCGRLPTIIGPSLDPKLSAGFDPEETLAGETDVIDLARAVLSSALHSGRDCMRRCIVLAFLCGSLLPGCIAAAVPQEGIPNFSPSANIAWLSDSPGGLIPSPTGPQPVGVDPVIFDRDHPFDYDRSFPVLDLTNPNLQPWVIDTLRAQNERVLSGKPVFAPSSGGWPSGVPTILRYNRPVLIIQSAEKVVIIQEQNNQVRRVLLNQQHSSRPKPSWYGESVGYYENGDTLVIDTIGLNDRTYLDLFRTPHSLSLHVIERWRLAADGREIDVKVRVEDPGALKAPYELTKHYNRVEGPWPEVIFAENPYDLLQQGLEPAPQADKPDF